MQTGPRAKFVEPTKPTNMQMLVGFDFGILLLDLRQGEALSLLFAHHFSRKYPSKAYKRPSNTVPMQKYA
jgi:hypothetical protein